jgi:DNA-binding transcriptional regulator GbsR (MarR family)
MGTRWGINRTVAQVHALLYISPSPLCADEIVEALSVARSNVSTSLKELQGWGIVRVVHVIGDRRDHFESMRDVWEMFRVIVEERKKREVDPTLALLRECMADAGEPDSGADQTFRERVGELRNFFETFDTFHAQMRKVPTAVLLKAVKLGDKAIKLLRLGGG